jgi:hypothetical protein
MANFKYRLNEIIVRNQANHDMAESLEKDLLDHCQAKLEAEFVGHKFRVHVQYTDYGDCPSLDQIDTMSVLVDAVDDFLYLVDGRACTMAYDDTHHNVITMEKRPIPIEHIEKFIEVLTKETGIKTTMRTDDVRRYVDSVIKAKTE